MIYKFLDIFFVVFHSAWILFNLSGWIWRKTRILNLVVLFLTGASWLIIGMIVGTIGYCPLTDWHFAILYRLGESELPSSYIKYLVDRLTGVDINSNLVDQVTLFTFIILVLISVALNVRDFMSGHRS